MSRSLREILVPSHERGKKLLRLSLKVLLSLFVGGLIAQLLYWPLVWIPSPDVVVPEQPAPTVDGDRSSLGGSFLERRDGYWFFLHSGEAVTMGAEHAALGEFLSQRAETFMFEDFQDRLPLVLQPILPGVLMWQYRHMPDYTPTHQLEELYGFAETYTDRHRFPLNSYRRGLYYHALHDITQGLVGNPWVDPAVAGACTGFAASGVGSTDGHLIMGRNFDFEVVPLFDPQKVVHLYVRDGAIPLLSVSWAAMVGVLSGMNADGIWLTVNAARTTGVNRKGPTVSLWVRRILEEARSIEDVERILLADDPMVADIYLAGDGKTGEAVAFERGIHGLARRSLEGGKLSVANHMLSDRFASDEGNIALRDHSTTLARQLRMEELVAEQPLSVRRGVEILRDRRGPGGMALPPNHRNAIDALIAQHSLVGDVTDRVLWVSTAPHTQGRYQPVDLIAELEAAGFDASEWRGSLPAGARGWEHPSAPVAPEGGQADVPVIEVAQAAPAPIEQGDLLAGGEWSRYQRYLSFLKDAEDYIADGQWALALYLCDRAEALYPNSHTAAWFRGEAHRGAGDEQATRAAWTVYLNRYPDLGPKYFHVQRWFEARGGAPRVARPDLVLR